MADNENDAAGGKKKSSFVKKLMVLAVIGLVITIECVVTYIVLPSGNEVAAYQTDSSGDGGEDAGEDGDEKEPVVDVTKTAELDLGYYSITSHESTSNVTLRIEFQLFGITDIEKARDLRESLEGKKHRLRDRVIFEIRRAELTDLTDPELGLIKRRILEKSNDLFGKDTFDRIVVSEFTFVEQ